MQTPHYWLWSWMFLIYFRVIMSKRENKTATRLSITIGNLFRLTTADREANSTTGVDLTKTKYVCNIKKRWEMFTVKWNVMTCIWRFSFFNCGSLTLKIPYLPDLSRLLIFALLCPLTSLSLQAWQLLYIHFFNLYISLLISFHSSFHLSSHCFY